MRIKLPGTLVKIVTGAGGICRGNWTDHFLERGSCAMDHFIDALGDICPIPILKAEEKLKEIKDRERVIVETDHSCSIASVTSHFKNKYGYPSTVVEVEEGVWQITIEKKAAGD